MDIWSSGFSSNVNVSILELRAGVDFGLTKSGVYCSTGSAWRRIVGAVVCDYGTRRSIRSGAWQFAFYFWQNNQEGN